MASTPLTHIHVDPQGTGVRGLPGSLPPLLGHHWEHLLPALFPSSALVEVMVSLPIASGSIWEAESLPQWLAKSTLITPMTVPSSGTHLLARDGGGQGIVAQKAKLRCHNLKKLLEESHWEKVCFN